MQQTKRDELFFSCEYVFFWGETCAQENLPVIVYFPVPSSTQKLSSCSKLENQTSATAFVISGLKLPFQLVHRDRRNDNAAVHDILPERVHAQNIKTVSDGRFDDRADQSRDHVPFSAK